MKWTFEKCYEEALKYEKRSDFKTKSNGAYDRALSNKWLDNICSHMIKTRNIKNYWSIERCLEIASLYDNKSSFMKNETAAYSAAKRLKLLDKIFLKDDIIWTFETCQIEALKYLKRVDFQKNSSKAYDKARVNKWLDNICSHMKPKIIK